MNALELIAARSSRHLYRKAAERHAERALRAQDRGNRSQARYLARLALLLQRETEYDAVQARLERYVSG